MKFPIKSEGGRVRFIRASAIYYIEAEGDDILVRTRSKRPLRSLERISEAGRRLAGEGSFFRCHRSFLVNLDCVRALRPRERSGYEVRLDPPVNKWLPLSEDRYRELRRRMRLYWILPPDDASQEACPCTGRGLPSVSLADARGAVLDGPNAEAHVRDGFCLAVVQLSGVVCGKMKNPLR